MWKLLPILLTAALVAGCGDGSSRPVPEASNSFAPPLPTAAVARAAADSPQAVADVGAEPAARSRGRAAAQPPLDQAAPADGLSEEERVAADVFDRASPAVVRIDTGRGIGSGFLYDTLGHVVTNNHVIANSRGQVVVSFSGLFQTLGEVVGTDPDSDIAVVRVRDVPEGLEPLPLADSRAIRVGQRALAIGNPLGQDRTLTIGIVSAIGRTIQGESGGYSIGGAIQTDAAINPGNSGGPLLNAAGEVIGMTTAILSRSGTSSGIGFAVPSNLIEKVARALIRVGLYQHPYLGVRLRTVTTLEAEERRLPTAGVLIAPQGSESPVRSAGLTDDAILTAIDGVPVTSDASVIEYLELNTEAGQTVTLSLVTSDGTPRELPVVLGARPVPES